MADETPASGGLRDDGNVCQLCGALENLALCAGCRSAWYCCKDHQREDWKQHKRKCKSSKSTKSSASQNGDVACETSTNPEVGQSKGKRDTTDPNITSGDKQTGEEDQSAVKPQVWDDPSNAGAAARNGQQKGKKKSKGSNKVKEAGQLPSIAEEGSGERFFLDVKGLPQAIQSRDKSRSRRSAKRAMAPEGTTSTVNSKDAYVDVLLSRFDASAQYVVQCLKKYGICVLDSFLGDQNGEEILSEVLWFRDRGLMRQGEVVHASAMASGKIRGDIITWISGQEQNCENIRYLVSCMDAVVMKVSSLLETYTINERTKAMVACYPGKKTGYLRHVDNPNKDGRCITCIYYLNKDWNVQRDGGLLRIYPEGMDQMADVEPKFDRIIFFWSDRRNPHEVLPAHKERYAITVWYYEAEERARALQRFRDRDTREEAQAPTVPLQGPSSS